MADYISILNTAIEGMADNTPKARAVLYEKARDALKRQLDVLDKGAMSAAQAAAQLEALDVAVAEVERVCAAADAELASGIAAALSASPDQPDIEEAGEPDSADETEAAGDAATSAQPVPKADDPAENQAITTDPAPDVPPVLEETADAQDGDGGDEPETLIDDEPGDASNMMRPSAHDRTSEPPVSDEIDEDDDAAPVYAEDAPNPILEPVVTLETTEIGDARPVEDQAADMATDTGSDDDPDQEPVTESLETDADDGAAPEDPVSLPLDDDPEHAGGDAPGSEPDKAEIDPLLRVQSAVNEIEALTERTEPRFSEVIPFAPARAGADRETAPPSPAPELEPAPALVPRADFNTPPSMDEEIRVEPIEIPGTRRSSAWIVWLCVAIVVVAGGSWGYVKRDTVMPMLQTLAQKARALDEAAPVAEAPKIDDRVPADDASSSADGAPAEQTAQSEPAAPVAEPAQPVDAPAPASEAPSTSETPAVDDTVSADETPPATPAGPSLPLGSEAALLYEEGAGDNGTDLAHSGAIAWSVARETKPDGTPETVLRGETTIAPNGIGFAIFIRKNEDAALPASHTIEALFTIADDNPISKVKNMGGILLKDSEPERGETLIGAAAPVTEGFFIVGLSDLDEDKAKNIALLKTKTWFDIPLLFQSGGRGILTLAKGPTGQIAFDEAFTAWGE